jgi:hypothetical protein
MAVKRVESWSEMAISRPDMNPGAQVDSACNRDEYQESSWG